MPLTISPGISWKTLSQLQPSTDRPPDPMIPTFKSVNKTAHNHSARNYHYTIHPIPYPSLTNSSYKAGLDLSLSLSRSLLLSMKNPVYWRGDMKRQSLIYSFSNHLKQQSQRFCKENSVSHKPPILGIYKIYEYKIIKNNNRSSSFAMVFDM